MRTLAIAISLGLWLAAAFAQSAALRTGEVLTCRTDALHGKQWVTLRDPQRPWLPPRVVAAETFRTSIAAPACAIARASQSAVRIVKPGTNLQVIHQQEQVRTITPGVALASGSRGQVIRVRVQFMAGTRIVDAEILDANTVRRRD